MARAKDSKKMIVGLDIGTSKIVAIVAEVLDDDQLNIIGCGKVPSRGLKGGMVVNIDATVQSIQAALQEAELMADCKINEAYTSIVGRHIRSTNSDGTVAIKDREITQMDIDRAIESAKAIIIPPEHEMIHVVTQDFKIDGQDGVREPLGMSGVRLDVYVHIVTGAVSAVQNITRCVNRCGLEVSDLVLQPMASAEAVLSEDEKDLGVCMIDIGSGTTDVAIYANGSILHTAVLPIAGDSITSDIAIALRTPKAEAEEIKKQYGVAVISMADDNLSVDVAGVGERNARSTKQSTLAAVIEPRVEELLQLVLEKIRASGFEDMISAGVVLTGGASLMPGMVELTEEIFNLPVRVGVPKQVNGLVGIVEDPRFSTAVGLLIYGKGHMIGAHSSDKSDHDDSEGLFAKLQNWLKLNF